MFRRVGTSDSSQHNELEDDYGDYFDAEFLADLEIDPEELIQTFEKIWMPSVETQQEMDRIQMKKDAKLEILRADGIRCGQNKKRGSETVAKLESIRAECNYQSLIDKEQQARQTWVDEKRANDKAIVEAKHISHHNGFIRARLDEE